MIMIDYYYYYYYYYYQQYIQMVEYTKVNAKLSDSQIKKLKDAVKDNTGITLRTSLKMFNGNNLPLELLLTTRQKTKVRNALIITIIVCQLI